MGYLWPESDGEHARKLLNQAVYQLRKEFGEDAILSAADELRLNADVIGTDTASFEAALARDDAASAVSQYHGPLLDGFFLSDAPEFERWLDRERERVAGAYAKALETLAETAAQAGDYPGSAEWWKKRAAQDPYDSRVALRLMQVLEAGGNRAGALQHGTAHSRLLQSEFGIAPAAEVAALTRRLQGEPPAAVANAPHAPVRPTDGRDAAAPSVRASSSPALVSDTEPASSQRVSPAVSGARRGRYVMMTVVAAAVGASSFWLLGGDSDTRWLLRDALPAIEDHLAVADWESAFALARQAESRIPGSREVAELWPRLSWRVSINSEPQGATVYRQAYDASDDVWETLGVTPLVDVRIPYGLSRVRLELEGYRPLVRALGGAHINWSELTPINPDLLLVGPETYTLDTDQTLPPDKVRVPGWRLRLGADEMPLGDFFLGRYEVTNAEFRAFVDSGGYRQPSFWDPIVVKGDTLPWERAMSVFVDRTGQPGPSTWEAGDFRTGEGGLPVSGVSWYEAAAYARFVGQALPTAHHWQQALANSMFPWLLPASNFSGQGARPVTESRAMSHVGAFDLTGNVREWTSNAIGDERIILGGSWNDPYYIAGTADASALPEDRSAGNGFRLMQALDDPAVLARVHAPIAARTTAAALVEHEPVSDEVYAAYSRVFDYDRRPLDAALQGVDTTRMWIRERVRFDAGYGTEQMVLNLYLPTGGTPPYQTVVYWPGWDTFALSDADEYFAKQVDFIVKSGRAVAFPIYHGTFERRIGDVRRRPEFGTAEYRDNTIETVKELRRTIDYLETRSEVDTSALAFFGYSWGGVNGPAAMAQDRRIRVGVINIGLLPPMAATPEVDPVNALPRVRVPTLMFSGEFDPMVPRANQKRYFELLGVPPAQKKHVIAIGGHFIPRDLVIRETLKWLDVHLGRVGR